MLTGMLAVRNMVLGQHNDLWSVNTDQEYHEEIREKLTEHDLEEVLEGALTQVFLKLDRVAMGLSVGITSGALLFLATLALVLKGGPMVGPMLGLLGQYFPGYTVTGPGSLLGLLYGFLGGFVVGWAFAFLRNATVFLYMAVVHRRAELQALRRLLEYF